MATLDRDGAASENGVLWPALRSVVEHNYPIGHLTTYRVGGSARYYIEVLDDEDLNAIAAFIAQIGIESIVIGLGSNLLIPDCGFDGVALRLGETFATAVIEGHSVVAGAATSLPRLARQSVAGGLTGFEWAVGVPGSVGGAARMNAGGHGSDMAASVLTVSGVDLLDGSRFEFSNNEMAFGYRSSALAAHHCVTQVRLELAPGEPETGNAELTEIVRWRRENQPGGQNAGSVFINPRGNSAGRLIDQAGCKGLRVGSAEISTKHANFIQADPEGSADDVLALMEVVTERVLAAFGVELIPETRILGQNFGPTTITRGD